MRCTGRMTVHVSISHAIEHNEVTDSGRRALIDEHRCQTTALRYSEVKATCAELSDTQSTILPVVQTCQLDSARGPNGHPPVDRNPIPQRFGRTEIDKIVWGQAAIMVIRVDDPT